MHSPQRSSQSTSDLYEKGRIGRAQKEMANGHESASFWLTGLSGSGKTTIAHTVEQMLYKRGFKVSTLDGDNLRYSLNSDLLFTDACRAENLRRAAEVSKLLLSNGIICICSFIAPLQSHRNLIKRTLGDDYNEIHLKCPLEKCIKRDKKGLYDLSQKGILNNFTGISSPYEIPKTPDLILDTDSESITLSSNKMYEFILQTIQSKGLNK